MGKLYFIDERRKVNAIVSDIRMAYRSKVTQAALERVFLSTLSMPVTAVLTSLGVRGELQGGVVQRLAVVFATAVLHHRKREMRELDENLAEGMKQYE